MHYYKRNLGDYAKKAGRLSMLQHGSYTLLIDACYDREQFPTLEDAIEWTWASTTEEVEAVTFVLRKFFTLEDGVYVQKRIQEEIAEYHAKAETNKRIAMEREETKRAANSTKRTPSVDGSADSANGSSPNHKPLTNNQEPVVKTSVGKRQVEYTSAFNEAWMAYPERPGNNKAGAFKAWSARLKAGDTAQDMADGIKRYAAYCEAMKTEPRFIKQAATFLGPDRHFIDTWTPAAPVRAAAESFAERDERKARERIAEATGQLSAVVIDMNMQRIA